MKTYCETCEGTGYIWRKGPDGRQWMCDCDNPECNAWDEECAQCGALCDDGEGYDGLCGNCADAKEGKS